MVLQDGQSYENFDEVLDISQLPANKIQNATGECILQ